MISIIYVPIILVSILLLKLLITIVRVMLVKKETRRIMKMDPSKVFTDYEEDKKNRRKK